VSIAIDNEDAPVFRAAEHMRVGNEIRPPTADARTLGIQFHDRISWWVDEWIIAEKDENVTAGINCNVAHPSGQPRQISSRTLDAIAPLAKPHNKQPHRHRLLCFLKPSHAALG
jgi:hypothetical protein